MDSEAPMRAHRRGYRRWMGITLVALPVAGFVLANLWLTLAPGRAWAAAKIQSRIGLETHIGGIAVSPWHGVILRDVELLQPPPLRSALREPLARIGAVRLAPVWRSWLRGRPELRSLELESPALVIPLELLADLARSQSPPPAAAPPMIAAAPPQPAPPAAAEAVPQPASPAAPAAPESGPPAPAIVLPPTGWLHLKNASITVLSASSGRKWFELSGATGSIPVSGSPAKSSFRVESIRADGQETLSRLDAELDWKFPLLSLRPLETDIHGYKLTFAAKLGMLSNLPLQIEAQFPRQPLAAFPLPADGHAQAEAIAANARFRGLMLAPGTWQGDLIAEAVSPSGRIAGNDAKFDRGSAVTVLRGGILSCVDARLISDELSFLGNATMLADGRVAAALRMVAPPESAAAIASRVFPNLPQPPSLTPLSTPQRSAFDVQAAGNPGHISLKLGREGPIVELKQQP